MSPILAAVDLPLVFMELGGAVTLLALLARLANRFSISTIPLYLIGGLAFGNGGLLPLKMTEGFVHIGAEIGVLLLLFMLGLEYAAEDLGRNLRKGFPGGAVDLLLNFPPGLIAGFILGWGPLASVLMGGVTYISSSGIVARLIEELKWQANPETPTLLSILVLEDLAMAVYLPMVGVLLVGRSPVEGVLSVVVAVATVALILFAAIRYGMGISRWLSTGSDEVLLLSTSGLVLLVAGIAQKLQVSAAIGAFLVGIALSGPVTERAHRLIAPLRDLFAATFFFFFGLEIDPRDLPPVLGPAIALGSVTIVTKLLTGWWAARRAGVDVAGRVRAGAALVARGEFSVVVAGLGVSAGLNPKLGPLSAAYVLLLAISGTILARVVGPLVAVAEAESSPA